MKDLTINKRLESLDVIRGFDMFFIIGDGAIFAGLATLIPIPFFQTIAKQMVHVPWNGFHFEDLIFSLFLFIAGISFTFSVDKQRKNNSSNRQIVLKCIRRGLMLVFLGVIYNGFLKTWDFSGTRYCSVLARIGLGWMFASIITIYTKPKFRFLLILFILVGYYLLIGFVPAPDAGHAPIFTRQGSLVGYIDRLFAPGKMLGYNFDPEGILSTVPAIATALLGIFAGEWIKYAKDKLSGNKTVCYMLLVGLLMIATSLLWNPFFPINKRLWSSTFVLLTGGLSLILFAVFYWLIDIKGYKNNKIVFFFRVIGLNSIFIYLIQHFINFEELTNNIFGGFINLFPATSHEFLSAIGYLFICWMLLYFLYKNKFFFKV